MEKMKQLYTFLLVFFSWSTFGQEPAILVEPKVDERVELLSIVFRLADCHEYSSNLFPKYVEKIEEHFSTYKNHDLVKYIKKKLRKKGVAYDAVMQMAISISETYPFQPLVPFSQEIPEERWGKKRAIKFLELLNDFYVDANCKYFFSSNQELYSTASENFKKIYEKLDINWYQEFYGEKPKGEFRIVNGLGNGGGNYGSQISINKKEIMYAIMGTWSTDSSGHPNYIVDDYFPTLLHEFNHSFVNHIVEKYHKELTISGEKIYLPLKDKMQSQAYSNWQIMYVESIVRAAVIKYMIDHHFDTEIINDEITAQKNRGFLWTDKLVDELIRYDDERSKYSTLESFIPEIVKFFDSISNNIEYLNN